MYGKQIAIGTGVIAVAGAISGLLSFGVYGWLRESKKWSTWKAGAVTGVLGGLAGWGMFLANAARTIGTLEPAMSGLSGLTVTEAPENIAGLTMSKLSGLTMSQLSGLQVNGMNLNDFQIGAVGVDPLTMQPIGYNEPFGSADIQL